MLGEVARKIHSKTANVLLFPLSEIKVKKSDLRSQHFLIAL